VLNALQQLHNILNYTKMNVKHEQIKIQFVLALLAHAAGDTTFQNYKNKWLWSNTLAAALCSHYSFDAGLTFTGDEL